jgi:hypothetical protein
MADMKGGRLVRQKVGKKAQKMDLQWADRKAVGMAVLLATR